MMMKITNSEKENKKCSDNCRKCRNKRKIIIIGDSHAKGSTANIKQVLGKSTEIIGYISTGAKLNHLTGMANNEINKLSKKDTVVIWSGAMDIAKNEADRGLAHLSKFVGDCSNTKVLVEGAPKRHDLRESSCVNKEVDKFNRQLHKRLKTCEHVKIIDSVIWKEYHTKHGLHLNNSGKELMAQLIIDQIKCFETTETNPPPFTYHK
jgi:hypothetical protein